MATNNNELVKLRNERTQIRRKFSESLNQIQTFLDEGSSNDEFQEEFAKASDKAGRLFKLDEKINNLMFSEVVDEKEIELEYDTSETYRDRWNKLLYKKEKFDKSSLQESSVNASIDSFVESKKPNSEIKYRLPKLEITKFDGSIKSWINFWAQFRKIHESTELDDEEKFQYLIQSTKDNSPARSLVQSYPPSATNYEKAIDQLKRRFGRDELLIELYVRELLNLVLIQATASKNSLTLRNLYDKLETQLRSLESLGVTSSKYACMLYPLIESSLPSTTLKEWERRRHVQYDEEENDSTPETNRLKELMSFLRKEVESDERLALVKQSFTVGPDQSSENSSGSDLKEGKKTYDRFKLKNKTPTAADLINVKDTCKSNNIGCVFCEGQHASESCFKAKNMSLDSLNKVLKDKACCFLCFKKGHTSRKCRYASNIKCMICLKQHVTLLCPKRVDLEEKKEPENDIKVEQSLSNTNYNKVLLQTLQVRLRGGKPTTARLLIDTGSQRSYMTKELVKVMNYKPIGEEKVRHALFGGVNTDVKHHKIFKVRLENLDSSYCCNFDVLDSDQICTHVPVTSQGSWVNELKEMNISLSDYQEGPIDILVGADVAGKLFTGKRKVLSSGLVAIETLLGWTIMGRVKDSSNDYMNVCMFTADIVQPSDLWKLDVIGIEEPAEVKSKKQTIMHAEQHFEETVKTLDDGRYEVKLPWLDEHLPLPQNFELAKKRLQSTVTKLKHASLESEYGNVFSEWLADGVIEEVKSEDWNAGHYLPHRAVVKEGSTTRIRPVFDASASLKGHPSLNQCLEKGSNLIEQIPSLLLRFRLDNLGVIADIKRAFLQISINEHDRDFLRFLWIDEDNELKIFRHRRVVFGVSCSPFLLGAVMNHHLNRCENRANSNEGYSDCSISTIHKLKKSFYVDNLVTSVSNKMELLEFENEAKAIFAEAKFDLRGWEYSDPDLLDETKTHVLGHIWDKKNDTLKINITEWSMSDTVNLTRRDLLSATQKIFDTLGLTCPTTIIPKLLIQNTWTNGGDWDTSIEEEIKKKFISWINEVKMLNDIQITRSIDYFNKDSNFSLHTFCDASSVAYAAVCFLRCEVNGHVVLNFIVAKSRVAPIKKLTIPRLELMAATIGCRLAHAVLEELGNVETFYWSDSTTTLAWIKNDEPWGVFVYNRVQEIRKLSNPKDWRHVPGTLNPADIASRGCSPKKLIETKWWEGPKWLLQPNYNWPINDMIDLNENEVNFEKRKNTILATNMCVPKGNFISEELTKRFTDYYKIVKLVGWMERFWINCSKPIDQRKHGDLTLEEINKAEQRIVKIVQQESFQGIADKKLSKLGPFLDSNGVIRLKTKIWMRSDTKDFREPVVLPTDHVIVQRLIFYKHCKCLHLNGQGLLNLLRENYWILRGRQAIKKVTNNCLKCKRQTGKPFEAECPPLPENRVKEATVFEVIGVDMCGPLYTIDKSKVYVCIFTCAIYRAVHLEVVSTLETDTFIMAFRRFVARRGRPKIVYSDNGKNFRGMANALKKVDFDKVKQFSTEEKIDWRFNPPSAPWWGGFWERLIRILKNILRRVLGKTTLCAEELQTVVCECEAYINSRPITYTSDDSKDPVPITPKMFIQEIQEIGVSDCDVIDKSRCLDTTIQRKLKYKLKLKEELKRRFRIEYLGQLKYSQQKNTREPIEGELVIVEVDKKKRLDWPLAIVERVVPGRDGKGRVLHLRTKDGLLCRPVQRAVPMEVFKTDERS